nr:hypothetical protein [Tanacetum cinerariifolium]
MARVSWIAVLTNFLMRAVVAPRRNKEIPSMVGVSKPRHQKKRKTMTPQVGWSLHYPKNLREDHETSSGPPIVGKSRSSVPVMTALTTTTLTADPAAIVKEKLLNPLCLLPILLSLRELILMLVFFLILSGVTLLLVVSVLSSALIRIFRRCTCPNGA